MKTDRIKIYALWAVIMLFFSSCVEDVDLEGRVDTTPKMVVNCMISPELDSVILLLTQTAPIFSKGEIAILTQALVEISNDQQQWHRLNFNSMLQRYVITHEEFPVEHGKTYYLRASNPGFENVTASCKVPYYRETPLNYKILSKKFKEDAFFSTAYYIYDIGLEWQDYPSEENYYYFLPYEEYEEYGWDNSIYFRSDAYPTKLLLSDKGKDGQKLSVTIKDMYVSYYDEKQPPLYPLMAVQMDKHLFMYESRQSDSDLDFFNMEPSGIYTNVNNGYGVFGAFTMRKIPEIPFVEK